jgi:TonB-linked SusC/RagA family outer membrane protein
VVLSALAADPAEAQQGTITGRVVNAQGGQPVGAVQIFIPALDLGVLSDVNGSYNLANVPAGTHTITAQRIGFRAVTATISVVGGEVAVQNFELPEEALQLDAVVVTGTAGGTQRRAVGNVVERVDVADLIEQRPIINVEQALSSTIPGLSTVGDVGIVGGGAQIRLRGSSSAALPGDPIIYVDGVRLQSSRGMTQTASGGPTGESRHIAVSRLNDINPADIESIEVIKGPAAATLYGTEASNGVIQIVTKRGQEGAAAFDASLETGVNWMPDRFLGRIWTPTGYLGDNVTGINTGLLLGEQARVNIEQIERDRGNRIIGAAPFQTYSLSVRGGTDLIRYFASINRTDQNGVVDWMSDARNSVRANITVTPRESLTFSVLLGHTRGRTSTEAGGFYGSEHGWGGDPEAVFDPRFIRENVPATAYVLTDITSEVEEDFLETKRTTVSFEVRHSPAGWVTHRLVAGLDDFDERRTEFTPYDETLADYLGSITGGSFTEFRNGSKETTLEELPVVTLDASGTLSFDLTPQVNSATSYGLQYYNTQRRLTYASGEGFATSPLKTVGSAARTQANESFLENTTVGFYVQEQVGWRGRAFFTGAVRFDDNSAFGADFDMAVYPKASATWVVHEEDFWNVGWMSQFRLRAAWGAAGKQPDAFAASRLYTPIAGPDAQTAITPQSFGNPDLGPERGEEVEVGFDTEMFDGRLSGTFTWFSRKTKDALVAQPLGPSIGFTAQTLGSTRLVNLGTVSSWGTETQLTASLLDDPALSWDMTLAFTTLGNRLDDMGDVERIPLQRGRSHVEGYPLASLFEPRVYSAEFVNGVSGKITNAMCDGGRGSDGRLQGGPAVPCNADTPYLFWGTGEPTRIASLVSNWTLFTDWRVSTTVEYKGGHWMSSDYLGARTGCCGGNLVRQQLDNPIGIAYYTQMTRNGMTYHKAGFAKLRDINVTYSVPVAFAERFGFSRAQVNVGMRNVANLWVAQSHVERERAYDPEMSRPDENFGGEAGGGWPPLSSVTVGLRVSF